MSGLLLGFEVNQIVAILERQKSRICPIQITIISSNGIDRTLIILALPQGELIALISDDFQESTIRILVEELSNRIGIGVETTLPILFHELSESFDRTVDQSLYDLVLHQIVLHPTPGLCEFLRGLRFPAVSVDFLQECFLPVSGDVLICEGEVVLVKDIVSYVDLQLLQLRQH